MADSDERSELITVELGKKGATIAGRPGASAIFHDRDARHPGDGEVLVVAGRTVQAFPTPRVLDAIARGILRDVTGVKPATTPAPDVSQLMDAERAALRDASPAAQAAAGVPTSLSIGDGAAGGTAGEQPEAAGKKK